MPPPRKPAPERHPLADAGAGRPAAPAARRSALPDWPCLRQQGDVCVLDISVQPNARRTALDGLHDGALRVRLAAPPVDGKANAALQAWLADELGCARRAVTLLRGDTSRRKQWQIDLPAQRLCDWLAQATAEPGAESPPAAPASLPGEASDDAPRSARAHARGPSHPGAPR